MKNGNNRILKLNKLFRTQCNVMSKNKYVSQYSYSKTNV